MAYGYVPRVCWRGCNPPAAQASLPLTLDKAAYVASTEKIDEAAADWIARLDRADPPAELRVDFERWCRADPRHYAAYLRLQHVWGRLDRLNALQPPALAPVSKPVRRARGPRVMLSRVAAAAVLLGVAVSVWLWHGSLGLGSPERRYVTPVGGFERVTLSDGSIVQLNTGSEVRVVLAKGRRDVRLAQGEATFEVAKDPSRPFVVTTGAMAVRAVGTDFNVRKTSSGMEVMIMEGAVVVGPVSAVNHPEAMPVVGAGRVAVITAAAPVHLQKIDADEMARRLAWQRGMLGFNGQPLTEVAEEFNRYNDRKLVIASPAVGKLRIGGYFRATNLEAFVSVIEERFGISVSREPGRIILGRVGNGPRAR